MSNKYAFILLCTCCMALTGYAQQDSTVSQTLEEVILSASKWEQKLSEIPNKITRVTRQQIQFGNPQTSADLLGQTGAVFIQKSQLGGGSPMIRGFATNRVLLVVDGVRMNNAIYRSGNLQNVISIDALATESAEVIFGPGSLIYGSDAIGGVIDFHSLAARFSANEKTLVKANIIGRYSTANKEKTAHADINIGWKKWALLSSFSYSGFDDLHMGKKGGQNNYLRPEYVIRQNNNDVIVPNSDPRIQRFSGYDQLNLLQKLGFKPAEHWDLQYSFTYAKTGDAPRYDRLIQYRNATLRFAEWYYGPMIWQMHNLQVLHTKKNSWYDETRLTLAYQDYEESRIDRTRNNNNRNRQEEHVDAISLNWDATKSFSKHQFFYGAEYVHNKVGSLGIRTNISNGSATPMASRYPDGSTWSTAGIYSSLKLNLAPKFTLTTGLRYSFNSLNATFDTTFIKFPYQQTKLRDGALTGSAGFVFRPDGGWQLKGNISTGYRMPNVDDAGKLFESVPGNITVPNPQLKPEYAWNFEAAILKEAAGKFRIELAGFHTILTDAIVRRPFSFAGQNSILFDGIMSQVEALQNVARATVWGLQAGAEVFFCPSLSLQTYANFITGKETDDVNDAQVPLRHAPPFYGSTLLRYRAQKWWIELSAIYNSEVKNEDLAPSEQAKTDIYARDNNGLPYSPGWYTLNFRISYPLIKKLQLIYGWENISNQRYRPYSSGIVAAGSNFIVSLRASL